MYDFISILFVRYLVDLLNLVYPNIKINNKGQIWKDIALTSFCGKYFNIEFKTSTPLKNFFFYTYFVVLALHPADSKSAGMIYFNFK